MKLPQISQPIYEVPLLSVKDPVKFRPFTVREEKIMMMAVEARDLETTVNALKQIINNCAVTELNPEDLAMVDMETFFLHLRARSVGEIGNQFYKCKNVVSGKECGMLIDVPINFLQVPIINKDVPKNITLTDNLGVKMKYPSLSLAKKVANVPLPELEVTIAALCIDEVYDREQVIKASDCTQDELVEFVLKLPTDKYELIKDFCTAVPKNCLVVKKKCVKCDFDHTFTLEGIQDFFG
jgi:T4 bacteriophage base plate protein